MTKRVGALARAEESFTRTAGKHGNHHHRGTRMNRRSCSRLAVASLLVAAFSSPALAEGEGDEDAGALPTPETMEEHTPTPAPKPDAPAEEDATTGYFRVDVDGFGTGVWAGAYHKLGSLTLASDIYMLGATGELDLGLTFTFGELVTTAFA